MNLKDRNKSTLEVLVELVSYKKDVVENLDRLRKMQGTAVDDKNRIFSKCGTVKFETSYGASVHTHSYNDSEINELLVNTAITYYANKLQSLELLLGLAERAVAKELEGM